MQLTADADSQESQPIVSLAVPTQVHDLVTEEVELPPCLSVSPDHVNIDLSQTLSSGDNDLVDQLGEAGKKSTRQWIAWTREEEENFFSALRNVGKNFEKITVRVQSKNKKQVRDYYYRLIKRMNKLLGPTVVVNARNTKDANAAMLRWWSLLERHQCSAAKLHLKPRRFNKFVSTLKHQLLKDQKKPRRKVYCSENKQSAASPETKQPGSEIHLPKASILGRQGGQKAKTAKGIALKRNATGGLQKGNDDASTLKFSRKRRKTGSICSPEYKRWEEAAIAGVSLVADAAEQLEQNSSKGPLASTSDVRIDRHFDGEAKIQMLPSSSPAIVPPSRDAGVPIDTEGKAYPSDHTITQESKLRVQFFPIDDCIRKGLEKDGHNPHLELTLKAQKKICSIIEHLNRKWGQSSIASGELMLFPYDADLKNTDTHLRWGLGDRLTAGDVHAAIGSPSIFRLRYGWCSDTNTNLAAPALCAENFPKPTSKDCNHHVLDGTNNLEALNQDISIPWLGEDSNDGFFRNLFRTADNLQANKAPSLITDWTDGVSSYSLNLLFSEASRAAGAASSQHSIGSKYPEHTPFTSDSFDEAIAAHIYRNQHVISAPPPNPPASSIWDGEETRDAFSFQRNPPKCSIRSTSNNTPASCSGNAPTYMQPPAVNEDDGEEMLVDSCVDSLKLVDENDVYREEDDIKGLNSSDIWDLDVSLPRFPMQRIDSLGSLPNLSGLIASSLDAFHSCSFFTAEKKLPSEGPQPQVVNDDKKGSEI